MLPQNFDKPYPPLVTLRQWSDVVFLQWQALFQGSSKQGNINGLHYVSRVQISNSQTTALVDKALKDDGQSVGSWPGHSFLPNSDGFQALLGSPNGGGVAWLLIYHKHQLGLKSVSKITVFHHDGQVADAGLTMLFWLKDVEINAGDNGDEEGDGGEG